MATMMTFTLTHRSQKHILTLPSSALVSSLRQEIHYLTSVPPSNQKLLPKPAKGVTLTPAATTDAVTLQEAGLKDGMSIMVLGATAEEVGKVKQEEAEASKWKQPRNYHPSMLQGTKPRSTATASAPNPFHSIAPHASLSQDSPLHAQITAYLSRLAHDPGIVHICSLHGYTVGHLTELLPWQNPELLGLNENKGQTIRLRVRTDDADGLRDYKTTRTVLVHELAHIDVSDHPPEFKILNSKLNAELAAFEKNAKEGRHSLVEGEMYVPAESGSTGAGGTQGGSYVLGGAGLRSDESSTQERRDAILQATLKRMEKLEAEIEGGCGSGSSERPKQ